MPTPPATPLQVRLGRLAQVLVVVGIGVTLALAGAMLARGEPLREAFLVGVSVAVAAVPEGLAAILTIALAIGSRAMARRQAIVRTLSAIETVGEATDDLRRQDRNAHREPDASSRGSSRRPGRTSAPSWARRPQPPRPRSTRSTGR